MGNRLPHLDQSFEITQYACPLINPPSQSGLFENKLHNIRLAISRMAPLVLQSGQTFSFWDMALAPTAENGYREGAMFLNHAVRTSLGGGLCQLSGLLYNLALLSGCKIIERFNHSIDAYGEDRYIPLGRDATVAYGKKNLRFKNVHNFPLCFELHVDAQRAAGKVHGRQALNHSIFIETNLIRTIASPERRVADASLPVSDELRIPGLTGKVVEAWRVSSDATAMRSKELLSRDCYAATPTFIRYGHNGNASWLRRVTDRLGLYR